MTGVCLENTFSHCEEMKAVGGGYRYNYAASKATDIEVSHNQTVIAACIGASCESGPDVIGINRLSIITRNCVNLTAKVMFESKPCRETHFRYFVGNGEEKEKELEQQPEHQPSLVIIGCIIAVVIVAFVFYFARFMWRQKRKEEQRPATCSDSLNPFLFFSCSSEGISEMESGGKTRVHCETESSSPEAHSMDHRLSNGATQTAGVLSQSKGDLEDLSSGAVDVPEANTASDNLPLNSNQRGSPGGLNGNKGNISRKSLFDDRAQVDQSPADHLKEDQLLLPLNGTAVHKVTVEARPLVKRLDPGYEEVG
ncbi:uncharacterized protein LOC130119836 [Lampris incognitus]|uniref:uncharacterized protein LOC130119836 n=1 Tax=Lampris incognitus TaxID=2546036 RepID=UPI0024B5DFDC|nr:uncharacterized protein LOC130119836 [Lampris incognitus]